MKEKAAKASLYFKTNSRFFNFCRADIFQFVENVKSRRICLESKILVN